MRIRSLLVATAALATTATMALASPAAASPVEKPAPVPVGSAPAPQVGPMSCTHAHSNKDPRPNGRLMTGEDVRIRRGPHISCTADGQAYTTHTIDYHCWDFGDSVTRNGTVYTSWTYIRDVTTGVSGWVSDAFLVGGGAADQYRC